MELIEKIINVDLLIIDEMSDDKITVFQSEYQIPFLTTFLKRRLETIKKSTIFISNHSKEKLYEGKLGKTIADLINRECKDFMFFKDVYSVEVSKNIIKDIWN